MMQKEKQLITVARLKCAVYTENRIEPINTVMWAGERKDGVAIISHKHGEKK